MIKLGIKYVPDFFQSANGCSVIPDISTSAINLLPVTLRKRPPGLSSYCLELPSGVAEVRTPEISNKNYLPVVVFLHGAGHVDGGAMDVLCREVSSKKFILLAPSAYRDSWDILRGGWGEDVAALNEQLNWLREHYMIDDNRISMLGFSDGASYALSLCVRNPVISCAAALSPGFYLGNAQSSSLFISHAQNDNILSFSGVQRLRTQLLEEGANVTFMMHDAGHSCPERVVTVALTFCLGNAIPPDSINTNVYGC